MFFEINTCNHTLWTFHPIDRCSVTVQPAGSVGKRHVFLTLAFEDDNNARQIELVLSECAANRLGQALISGSVGVGWDFNLVNGPDWDPQCRVTSFDSMPEHQPVNDWKPTGGWSCTVTGPDGWLFASETLKTAIGADNLMLRYMRPLLKTVGLGWVDYRVMRRTHSSLMKELKVDPKLVADQQGHGVDVNQNVYTQTPLTTRLEAVETLSAFVDWFVNAVEVR